MKREIIETVLRCISIIAGFLAAFSWTVIGVTTLPNVVAIAEEGSLVPSLTSLGIVCGTIIIIFKTMKKISGDDK